MKYAQCFYLQWKSNALTDKLCPIFCALIYPSTQSGFCFFWKDFSLFSGLFCFQLSFILSKKEWLSLSQQSECSGPTLLVYRSFISSYCSHTSFARGKILLFLCLSCKGKKKVYVKQQLTALFKSKLPVASHFRCYAICVVWDFLKWKYLA